MSWNSGDARRRLKTAERVKGGEGSSLASDAAEGWRGRGRGAMETVLSPVIRRTLTTPARAASAARAAVTRL